MENDDEIFDNYVPTTVPIGQLLPLIVAGTTTCLLFLPVVRLLFRPSGQIDEDDNDHENSYPRTPSKITISLAEKVEETEYAPLFPSKSADSSEYGGLSRSSTPRLSQIGNLHSFESKPRKKSLRTLDSQDSFNSFQDDEIGICNAIRFSDSNTSALEKFKIVTLHNCDAQTRSMLAIGFPYLIQTLFLAASQFIQMGVVGYQLGTDALTAYVVVDLFIRMTTEAVGYVITSGNSLMAQVVESEDCNRDRKVGNYLMLSILFYVIGMIPLVVFWSSYTKAFLLFLNLDPDMAEEGQEFARAYILAILISGVLSAFNFALDVVGYQVQSAVMTSIGAIFVTSGIFVVMCYHAMFPNPTLAKMGWTFVLLESCFFAGMLITIHVKGWLEPYYTGLFSSPLVIFRRNAGSPTNESGAGRAAVKLMVYNTVQYAISNFVFEGEWQILLLFASVLGTAELATWGVMGIIWEELELIVSAISEGCEVRVGQTLGRGDFKAAKLISYKAIWICLVWGIFVSILFLLFDDEIPMLVTKDPLLQEMVTYNLPMIALANLVSGIAVMAEHVLWSQNRATIATKIAIWTSIGATLPLTALSSCYFHFNLIGQTTGVAIGAAAFASISLYTVVGSDWKEIAETIRDLHADDSDIESEFHDEED